MANKVTEIYYDEKTIMKNGFPKITKLGAISPNQEPTPFVWNGKLMRLEWINPNNNPDPILNLNGGASSGSPAGIRDCESGKFISYVGGDIVFPSGYLEGDTMYVLGVVIGKRDTVRIYESKDLINWTSRDLFTNPGWCYFNTSLTKGPDGYVLCIEAVEPAEHVGEPFTMFFVTSPDLKEWSFMDYDLGYSKERYMGGPWMKYSEGYYYLITVTALPCRRYTNYVYRTKDFYTWEVGYYNPLLSPSEEDRAISKNAHFDLNERVKEKIKTGFLSSSSDIDLCDYNGKTYINYLLGNQVGFCYTAEAVYDGTLAEFLKSLFE